MFQNNVEDIEFLDLHLHTSCPCIHHPPYNLGSLFCPSLCLAVEYYQTRPDNALTKQLLSNV